MAPDSPPALTPDSIPGSTKEQIAQLLKQSPPSTGSGQAQASRDQQDQIRLDLRQRHSVPILAKIKAWLDAEQQLVLPRSPMAAAITYMLNQWTALCVYTTAGFLDIDNNAAERALKRVAIGRKNWLFAATTKLARATRTSTRCCPAPNGTAWTRRST